MCVNQNHNKRRPHIRNILSRPKHQLLTANVFRALPTTWSFGSCYEHQKKCILCPTTERWRSSKFNGLRCQTISNSMVDIVIDFIWFFFFGHSKRFTVARQSRRSHSQQPCIRIERDESSKNKMRKRIQRNYIITWMRKRCEQINMPSTSLLCSRTIFALNAPFRYAPRTEYKFNQ